MNALPIEVRGSDGQMLGMPPARFLRDYWQKRPLLVRDAFPGFASPIAPEDLAGLACEEFALSRLVRHDRERDAWQVQHGPFPEALFPTLGERDWTLLVQYVDKWDADVAALLPRFDFLPRWRIDDIMVSFAPTGGSVGAHVDQYDVFLVQGLGRRRWQVRGVKPVSLHLACSCSSGTSIPCGRRSCICTSLKSVVSVRRPDVEMPVMVWGNHTAGGLSAGTRRATSKSGSPVSGISSGFRPRKRSGTPGSSVHRSPAGLPTKSPGATWAT